MHASIIIIAICNLQCLRSVSLETFLDEFLYDSTTKIALVGCGCSVATEPAAEISHFWNISQVSANA